MINNTWHDLAEESFVSKMIPGDNILVHHLRSLAPRFFNNELIQLFTIHKEGLQKTQLFAALILAQMGLRPIVLESFHRYEVLSSGSLHSDTYQFRWQGQSFALRHQK